MLVRCVHSHKKTQQITLVLLLLREALSLALSVAHLAATQLVLVLVLHCFTVLLCMVAEDSMVWLC